MLNANRAKTEQSKQTVEKLSRDFAQLQTVALALMACGGETSSNGAGQHPWQNPGDLHENGNAKPKPMIPNRLRQVMPLLQDRARIARVRAQSPPALPD